MANRELRIRIDAELVQPGPNRHWHQELDVPVPPGYAPQDIPPFVRWQLDLATAALQERELGEARALRLLAAYDLRMRVIGRLLRRVPRDHRAQRLVAKIRELMEMDNEELFADYGDEGLED
jgi:hypothetical protein